MDSPRSRVLGAVRQSRTKVKVKGKRADPVSPALQRKRIRGWADASDAEVVKVTEDLSRSGSISAFKRPKLGPWLTDPEKIAAWDVLVALKLDRACRDTADYLALRKWAKEHGKRVVFLNNPELNESTPAGKAMGSLQAVFAEFERDMAVERNYDRYWAMVDDGKWPGGRVPYGWRYNAETEKLEHDDGGTADVLRAMADMAIDGKSYGQVARWLNGNGHMTVIGKQWRVDTVRRVLRASRTRELLGDAKAAELRAALRSREQVRGERVGGHMLLRVAFCRQCGSPLYCQVKHDRASGGYYRCLKCMIHVPKDKLESRTEDSLLFAYGHLEYVEYQLVPGDDHQAAIHTLEREIDALGQITGAESLINAKLAEAERLKSLPFTADEYKPVPQGVSVADHWDTLDDEGKGSFMRKRHVRMIADKHRFEFLGGMLEESETMTGALEPVRRNAR